MRIDWPEVVPWRLDRIKAAYEAASALRYVAERPGSDFWQNAVTTRRAGGDCEDLTEVLGEQVLSLTTEPGEEEALRLAVVWAPVADPRPPPSALNLDAWGLVLVPSVNHAALLWLADVDPRLPSDAYEEAWRRSGVWCVDPTWKLVCAWEESDFDLVWSWGLEGPDRLGAWRKHFERRPA